MTEQPYDAAQDGRQCYALAVAALREQGVREGRYPPQTRDECRWAAEGPVPSNRLEALHAR